MTLVAKGLYVKDYHDDDESNEADLKKFKIINSVSYKKQLAFNQWAIVVYT